VLRKIFGRKREVTQNWKEENLKKKLEEGK
jgi:hypothetical protein